VPTSAGDNGFNLAETKLTFHPLRVNWTSDGGALGAWSYSVACKQNASELLQEPHELWTTLDLGDDAFV
jgi:hypothetical protein